MSNEVKLGCQLDNANSGICVKCEGKVWLLKRCQYRKGMWQCTKLDWIEYSIE